tara:strand:- start:3942 stop:4232 length:291 start_codon:yes stop_codon:yes gene_type:complete
MSSENATSDIEVARPEQNQNAPKAWQVRDPMYANMREPIGDARYVPGSGRVNLEWWKGASEKERADFAKDQTARRKKAEEKVKALNAARHVNNRAK